MMGEITMIVIPEDKPVVLGIRTYYTHMNKLIDYYQKKIGTGCIHFAHPDAKGVLYFSPKGLDDGAYSDAILQKAGKEAIDHLLFIAQSHDYSMDIYAIDAENYSFWSRLRQAKTIHSNLSTEFTDLKKLILKMSGEKLFGFIDVLPGESSGKGRLFFSDGKFIGGVYSSKGNRLSRSKTDLEDLIRNITQTKGIFNVYGIAPSEIQTIVDGGAAVPSHSLSDQGIAVLQELMRIGEEVATTCKKGGIDFQTILKKKFVRDVDRFPFLDPFAGEFDYRDGKIEFKGHTDEKILARGLFESLSDLMEDLNLKEDFESHTKAWSIRHAGKIKEWSLF